MEIRYATLPGKLVRASTLYSEEELSARKLKPEAKVLSTDKALVTEQKWSKDTNSLLTTTSFRELLAISDKAVGIVHGLCTPPLITIDIDYDATKTKIIGDIVAGLPESEKPLVYSKSVGKVGLHITYHYTSNMMTNLVYQINKGGLGDKIDVLSSAGKLLFMGNRGNETKELISYRDTDELVPIPVSIQLAVMALFKDTPQTTINPARESGLYLPQHTSQPSKLGFLFEDFEKGNKELILNKFIAQRVPNDLKKDFNAPTGEEYPYQPKYYEGTPNDLLLRLSGSLKNDCGISEAQHRDILETINGMLRHSKNESDLMKHIIRPDQQDFVYREDWKTMAATLETTAKEILDIYVLTKHSGGKSTYLVHNTDSGQVRLFDSQSEIVTELNAEVTIPRKIVKNVVDKAPLVNKVDRPDMDFGLNDAHKDALDTRPSFNIYKRTLNQITFYTKTMPLGRTHQRPDITLRAIESQMGYDKTHELFLPFLKHKMLTRESSALIFALMGVPHSFKTGLLEGVVKPLFSSQRFLKTNGEILTEKYNDYLVNLDILFVDEFHHLHGSPLLKPVIQTLNKFGSEFHEGIRSMYATVSKGQDVPQEVTPFITMNKVIVPASETVGERRLVVGWGRRRVSDALDMDDKSIRDGIISEQIDFAYYLATEVQAINYNDYHRNDRWKTIDNDYYQFMEEGIPLSRKFALAIGASYEEPKLGKLKEMFPHIGACVVKLRCSMHGSKYRLRLWNAKGTSYDDMITIQGILDNQTEIDYNEVPKLLANNEKVLAPNAISADIRVRKQDLVISEELLIEHGLLTANGNPIYMQENMEFNEKE